MTNHENFPWWRLKDHIIIIFSNHFSSCKNTNENRKYLIESDYLKRAYAVIYPDKIQIYDPDDYKEVAKMENQEDEVG